MLQRSAYTRVSWKRWRGFTRSHAWRVAVAVVAIACAASVTALAASGYSVGVSASSPVASGHSFDVKARGVAEQKALLYVYLDRHACPAAWNSPEGGARRYKLGDSYFLVREGGPAKMLYTHAWVSGSFENSFTAHAGTAIGHEHACAYLETPNKYGGYRITAGHGSGGYAVTQ